VPAVVVLTWQYLVAYTSSPPDQAVGIVLAPLAAVGMDFWSLGPKLVLSILFPACVATLHFRVARGAVRLRFAWLGFLIGAAYTYLLAERGRVHHGNFGWSGQITSFIVFVTSVAFLIQQHPAAFSSLRATWKEARRDWRLLVCLVALTAHVASGIVWFRMHWRAAGLE
jgi:hypothetical protein